nr:efflux RND transporter permease subunit [uncultured Brevundimonas sp.]
MIGIVRIALQRPLTFIVMSILIAVAGVFAALRMPVDIFPEIRVPVLGVAWQYAGLPPEEMAGRILSIHQRSLTTTVNNIEHMEAHSIQGYGIIKVFLQPGADLQAATAQATAVSQSTLRQMPPGLTPPLIVNYSASTVPIVQVALSGDGLSEQQLFDLGQNQIRTQLTTVQGVAVPIPYGGRSRQIQIDLNPAALQAKGLSAQDIGLAIAAQNQINPVGVAKIGSLQYAVKLNNAPASVEEMNDIPVKMVDGATIYLRDVAQVRDGSGPQSNVVHVNGRRSALLTVLKNGTTSTIAIVDNVREKLPQILEGLPENLKADVIGDQSIFVRAAVDAVIKEGVIAAALTSLMILLFLGSWRSTVIIAVSIPLSVLAAIALLYSAGQTLNVMTLGGLALAVGILVDDATVTIENINWHLEQGKGVTASILDGAAQIVGPAFVSLLCICIVFVPMFYLPGVSGFLFVPLALSVIFAMIASFILSRTLVPTMAMYLLKPHVPKADRGPQDHAPRPGRMARLWSPLVRFQHRFEVLFERFRARYADLLARTVGSRKIFIVGFVAVVILSLGLTPFLGRNFFPEVDAGQIALHVRAPAGTRLEETAAELDRVQKHIRQVIPADEIGSMTDNIGLPGSSLNVLYNMTGSIGPQDGDILVQLKEGHRPTRDYVAALRAQLPRQFPGSTFAFLPADITSQTLNFGSPAPIDIQVSGRDREANYAYAEKVLREVRGIRGLADARIHQGNRAPQIKVNVDRSRIGQYGLTERDVTTSLGSSLAGTSQSSPVFFLNPENGVSYSVVAQTPEHRVDSMDELRNIPISGVNGSPPQTLGGIARFERATTVPIISHYNIQPVVDVFATTAGRDLGAVAADVDKALKNLEAQKPKGVTVTVRGQVKTMNDAFRGLSLGLLVAIVLIYFLIVVNFQSWADPFVIIMALPGALAGIIWMLFATGTTLSVPALTGATMCMGVATANSILVVSFARERLAATGDPIQSAIEAGAVRFRPVLMTALAMIIGMLPLAIGMGEGGEQNAPLGRAVIGGLVVATFATLFFVPAVFASIHHRRRHKAIAPELASPHA